MKWEEAIIQVLAEEGIPMSSVEITKKIIDKGYRDTTRNERPEQTVAGILSRNENGWFEHILEDGKCKGNYKLVETYESASHSYTASDKTVDREAPVVVRPCTSYDPSDSKYKCASDFIKSTVPSQDGKELLELIVNFRLPLEKGEVCFTDILDKLEVKFSDEDKKRDQTIDKALLEKKLEELKKQIAEIRKKAEYNHQLSNNDGAMLERMSSLVNKAECLLADSGDKVVVSDQLFGEFIPGKDGEDKPKVVIYLKSIENNLERDENRWDVMAAVFVHEMFHAWNYFKAEQKPRSVLAIDEPMVEFETLYFLKELETFAHSRSHHLKDKVIIVRSNSASRVHNKQISIGDMAAYGFGYYLFENLSDDDSKKWIETYSKKSASISRDSTVKNVEKALIPIYPFKSEAKVMEWFKKIIFNIQTTYVTTGKSAVKAGSHVSLRDLVLACIETIGRKCFDTQDIYAFAPIFKVCVPQYQNLESALKQQLDKLVNEGRLEALPEDCYSMK